jgi:hypothetical protein
MAQSYIFQGLAKKALAAGVVPRTDKSLQWFRSQVQNVSPQNMLSSSENDLVKRIDNSMIGTLCFYMYDPKGKDTLPYYDRFPMVFITDIHPDGWSGINIHYLPPVLRAQIMSSLYNTAINKKQPENMKLQISYKILKSMSVAPMVKQCYKKYLSGHVKSRIMKVRSNNWDMAVFLPTQRFVKKSAEQVWTETRKKVKQR